MDTLSQVLKQRANKIYGVVSVFFWGVTLFLLPHMLAREVVSTRRSVATTATVTAVDVGDTMGVLTYAYDFHGARYDAYWRFRPARSPTGTALSPPLTVGGTVQVWVDPMKPSWSTYPWKRVKPQIYLASVPMVVALAIGLVGCGVLPTGGMSLSKYLPIGGEVAAPMRWMFKAAAITYFAAAGSCIVAVGIMLFAMPTWQVEDGAALVGIVLGCVGSALIGVWLFRRSRAAPGGGGECVGT